MSVRSLRYNSLMLGQAKYRIASTDRDAAAFLEAAGIYKSDERKAIYELVRLLKQYGLWSKMKAIYPFVGGTATTHKWNLKDPRDLDAAYRLTFSGGWTHSGTGALPNGTNAWADTYFSPSANFSDEKGSIGFYSRTDNTNQSIDIGAWVATIGYTYIYTLFVISGVYYRDYRVNDSTQVLRVANPGRTDGLISAVRTATSAIAGYRNETNIVAGTNLSATRTNITISLSALKGFASPAGLYSDRELAFAYIGDGLTDTEVANLHYAVDKYQRLLSRNV